ncbi:MAG: L-rhamnose mutarotase, partial [Mucilaginibacter polytrichastri]|nr:L-rhamnose mutarotase [Mucilaginibacter polytrichastri]
MKRHILFLDLKDDDLLIAQYEEWHQKVWPEVIASIRDSGITNMEIFRCKNRLTMLMETDD